MAAASPAAAPPLAPLTEESSLMAEFQDPEFSPVAWVNRVIAAAHSPPTSPAASTAPGSQPSGPSSIDTAISDAQNLLQTASLDAHASLDASLTTALSAVPWAVREAEKIRQRASTLRASVDGIGARVEGVEASVSAAVSEIASADTVLRRVEGAAALLAQAARADTLLARLDELLASSAGDGEDLVSAADVVAELRATLEPLRTTEELKARFEMLDSADVRLETLAAPRLRDALETRNANAASNARIVFDRAGRDNAFVTQYVSIRAIKVADLWAAAWRDPDTNAADVAATRISNDDMSSTHAALKLDSFFEQLLDFLREEAAWLAAAFPDLSPVLVPSLLSAALRDLQSPTVAAIRPEPSSTSSSGMLRLHHAALRSVRAASDVARLFVLQCEDPVIMYDAVTSVLFPCHVFWSLWPALAAHAAESAANALSIEHHGPVSLADTAKRVEAASTPLLAALDSLFAQIMSWTHGSGVFAIPGATAAASAVVSRQILSLIQRDSSQSLSLSALPNSASITTVPGPLTATSGDDWGRVAGALRLLRAVSALKKSWELRKDNGCSMAGDAALPLLDLSSEIRLEPAACITCLIERADRGMWTEMSALFELVRDDSLETRLANVLEGVGTRGEDFRGLLDGVQRIVYHCMFAGIKNRFASFDKEPSWTEEATGDSHDGSLIGFSGSPLAYATEVADYLMTIPQQLEPYVPDEDEDDGYATPASVYAFTSIEDLEAEGEDVVALSFAGVWIGALGIGTMELYVERICALSRLSFAGAAQLAVDAEYIFNVLAALGVAPTPYLELARRLLECDAAFPAFKDMLNSCQENPKSCNIVRRIALARGIPGL
jgi:conserved oligomeric Golgi complex subunit 7